MNETDSNKILEDFFAPCKQEIPDKGFTRRVMKRLPRQERQTFSRLADLLLAAVCASLFYLMDGVAAVRLTLQGVLDYLLHDVLMNVDPKSLLIALAVILIIGFKKICSLA